MNMINLRHPLIHPFSGTDINCLVRDRAQNRGAHPFIIWEPFEGISETWTYARFARDVESIAAGLKLRGVFEGDRVLVHLDNCPETILAWYACARLGAVAVTTNARAAGAEMAYFAEHAEVVGAITQPSFVGLLEEFCPNLGWMVVTETNNGAAPPSGQRPDKDTSFQSLYADPEGLAPLSVDPMREVGIQYTSGTTSRPKGVVWTHANALWGARINAIHMDLRAEDVHLVFLPLFHTNAQSYSVASTLYAGATAVVQPRFSASRFWTTALKHRCTWLSYIMFCTRALMKHDIPKEHFFRLWGTAVCSPPTDEIFGVRTIGWWGMTETMTHGIIGDVHQPNRSLMIGKAAPEYGIAILDDDGNPSAPGEVGHLFVEGIPGLSLFKEYLKNPEATSASFDDNGWFITGDRVILHEDGFIQFSDRDKDMLKVGGENVAASEIERVIVQMPEVGEVAIVAKKHEMLDEVPVAFVIPEGDMSDAPADLVARITKACSNELADFKIPHEIRIVSEMPRSTLEKVAKAELRKLL
jgi:carnitine-CoA ligase